MKKQWNISIVETDDTLEAVITNMDSGESLPMIEVEKRYYLNRDEAIADLFAGPLPNLRDSFDTI